MGHHLRTERICGGVCRLSLVRWTASAKRSVFRLSTTCQHQRLLFLLGDDTTDAAEDVRAAVRWLQMEKNTYNLDPNRIATWGTSAGGMVGANLVCQLTEGESGNPDYPSNITGALSLSGALFTDSATAENLGAAYLDIHGTEDMQIPLDMAYDTQEVHSNLGIVSELVVLEGIGHNPLDMIEDYTEDIMGFLELHLSLEDSACPV